MQNVVPAYARVAVEKRKGFFSIIAYAFITMVGIDKGELHLSLKTTVPFLTINQNLVDSVGTREKWPPLVGCQLEIGHITRNFIV